MAEHGITAKDFEHADGIGTVATCLCGWRDAWMMQGGNAEASGHDHMRTVDPDYRRRENEAHAQWLVEHEARQVARKAALAANPPAPREPVTHYHSCSCHLSPPCSACTNCMHQGGDINDCPNDCQECEIDHDY